MKRLIIVLAVILTSGLTFLSISRGNSQTTVKKEIKGTSFTAQPPLTSANHLATAD